MLEYHVLGPLEIQATGKVHRLHGPLQNTLMMALLLRGDRLTPADTLIDELWGYGTPGRPENALQAHVSRLRRTLEQIEPRRSSPRLVRLPSGYRLVMDREDEVDSTSFVGTVAALEGEVRTAPPDRMADRLRAALGAWRGPVLGGIVGGAICQSGAGQLEEVRLRALEMLFDAELMRGNHAAIISDLSGLVSRETPLHEQFCEQLIIALYRSGRHADALATFRRHRHQLIDSTGSESPALRLYERAILCHDPILTAPRTRSSRGADSRLARTRV